MLTEWRGHFTAPWAILRILRIYNRKMELKL